jgi:dGTP triphosphohydrolase
MLSPKAKKAKGETIEDKRTKYKQNILDSDTDFANIASLLRTEAMNQLILNATYAFTEKYEFILSGVYTEQNGLINENGKINSLLDIYEHIMRKRPWNDTCGNSNNKLKSHSVISGYNNMNVLKNSLGGYEVMSELLKTLIAALHNLHKLKSQMVLSAIPESYLLNEIKLVLQKMNCVSCAEVLSDDQQITQIRLLNDYLTGLTDNAALNLFKHIKCHEQTTFA